MGNNKSILNADNTYNIYLDNDKIISDISLDIIEDKLSDIKDALIISNPDFTCVFDHPNSEEINVIGYRKHSPTIYPTLLHIISIESLG